jgi:hypothetical protein
MTRESDEEAESTLQWMDVIKRVCSGWWLTSNILLCWHMACWFCNCDGPLMLSQHANKLKWSTCLFIFIINVSFCIYVFSHFAPSTPPSIMLHNALHVYLLSEQCSKFSVTFCPVFFQYRHIISVICFLSCQQQQFLPTVFLFSLFSPYPKVVSSGHIVPPLNSELQYVVSIDINIQDCSCAICLYRYETWSVCLSVCPKI